MDKAAFALLTVITNAAAILLTVIIEHYVQDPILSSAIGVFTSTIANGLIVYFAIEGSKAPNGTSPATTSAGTITGSLYDLPLEEDGNAIDR